jgi:prepilin-type N-terminal cleavage/methylation domain-containing protein
MTKTRTECGFTLVEIMIVVAVIGMLFAIAIPNFAKARTTSQLNGCLENQRILSGVVALYELEYGTTLNTIANSGVAVRNAIVGAGYIVRSNAFDCTASPVLDFDDYRLSYNGTLLTGTVCTINSTHVLP